MKKRLGFLFLSAMVLLIGCEWEETDDSEAWNDSYNWVNFSGRYADSDGGLLVIAPGSGGGTEEQQIPVIDEGVGTGNGNPAYNGSVANTPVAANTLEIEAGGFVIYDDADGNLYEQGNPGTVIGEIVYSTGAWHFDVSPGTVAAGNPITADYAYIVGGEESQPDPGSEGVSIYHFIVEQMGNILRFTDSAGGVYEGSMGRLSGLGGDTTGSTSGDVTVNFEVRGTSSSGNSVSITGTFAGFYTSGGVVGQGENAVVQSGTLSGRVMLATWQDSAGFSGSIEAQAGSSTVSPASVGGTTP